ncbi:accessory factor UbiK family protein [Reinekea sp. G2M2-21]|uniref:accessory factor UbiK family protein n=1 Tax=Reinekea sp. G2M2-21 TaxID=2788942 RepID=UPI0018ABD3B3|nr:accessory factor UbiK family protein [Reinekea sp. G2M2-21]
MRTPEDFLDRISEQVNDLLGQSKQSSEDIKRNVRALIQAQLAKLDVVSREEFEVQQAILLKTRTQIEQLEQQLANLEAQINTRP